MEQPLQGSFLGLVLLPYDPKSTLSSWGSLGAPSPRCPHPVLFTQGPGTGNAPGTGNSTGRSPHSCTQHPGPTAAHGIRTHRGSGGWPGIGASAREEVGPAVAVCGSFLPEMLHPACAPLPCRPPPPGPPAPGRATDTRQAALLQPPCSVHDVPEQSGTETHPPALLWSPSCELEVPTRTGSHRQGLLK